MNKAIFLVKLFLLLSILSGDAAAQELKKVRLGYLSLGFRQGHIWVAKNEAYSEALMPNPKAQQTQEVSNNPVLVTLASQRRGPTKNIKRE